MTLHVSNLDQCVVLTLDRQQAMNALDMATLQALEQALDEIEVGKARALLVTGAGAKAFCGGADLKTLRDAPLEERLRFIQAGQAVLTRLERFRLPSIAVINGMALGGGLELALACTFRVAVAGARFALPEIRLGLIPGFGGTQRLPRLIGAAPAMEMITSGRMVESEEAKHLGLIDSILEGDPLQAGAQFAQRFSQHSLRALALARDAVRRAGDLPMQEGLAAEADLIALAFASHDANEGIAAFIDKRPPRFTDK